MEKEILSADQEITELFKEISEAPTDETPTTPAPEKVHHVDTSGMTKAEKINYLVDLLTETGIIKLEPMKGESND